MAEEVKETREDFEAQLEIKHQQMKTQYGTV